MDVISFDILFSVLTMIFRIACLENGDMKPPMIIRPCAVPVHQV